MTFWYVDVGQQVRIVNVDNGTFAGDITGPHKPNGFVSEGAPAWSRDGTKSVFYGNLEPFHNLEIYVVGMDGSNPIRLSGGTNPVYSPDGTQIAFDSDGVIWEMNADGSNQHSTGVVGVNPSWSK